MIDESKRSERVRDDRIQESARSEPVKLRPKETEFDKVLEKSRLSSQLLPQTQTQSKAVTEQAIKEAFKHEDRQRDEQKKDEGENKEGRDSHEKGKRAQGQIAEQKVIAKGHTKQQSGFGSGGRQQGGFASTNGRKNLSKMLTREASKSVPVDLQSKFASKLSKAMTAANAGQAVLTQQVLNKIVQYVRIGINQKGEKEIQIDLHERIFRGLKLRVIARGGKVGVHLNTGDSKGREVLEKNADAIRSALEKKGIDVDEILVS